MAQIDDLLAQQVKDVDAEDTVIDGAVVFINAQPAIIAALQAQVAAAGPLTPAQVAIFADTSTKMQARTAAVTAAMVANTPTPTVAAAQAAVAGRP
jgi:hypothetical protein